MQIDRKAFEELVRLHHAAVYRTARRVVGTDADAADIAQQVFERVLRGKADLPADADSAGPSLRWLAGRLALNHLRSSRRRRIHEEARAMIDRVGTDRTGGERADDRRAVRDALDALPDDQRVPLVLRYQEGLTLAAVAGVLGCAESTAHSRVRRALDALRGRLRDAGFAGAAGSVELALPEVAAPVAVPAGLEGALLGLSAPAAPLLAKIGLTAALVAVVAGVGVMAAGGFGGATADPVAPSRSSADAEVVTPAAEGDRRFATQPIGDLRRPVLGDPPTSRTPGSADPVDLPVARVSGRVIDPDAGLGLAGARVTASSEEPRGKGPRFAVGATSDPGGYFELELPVAHDGGQAYRIVALHDDHVAFRSERLVARAGETLPPLLCELRLWAEDVAGAWSMAVEVVDADGRPVPGARVTVLRLRRLLRTGERHPQEDHGDTDDAGRVTLRGDHHGEKVLQVRAPDSGLGPAEVGLRIAGAGPHRRVVELDAGLTIAGRVTAVDGGAPVADQWIEASLGGEVAGRAETAADGRFVIRGLAPGAHQLRAMTPGWSPFRIDDVPAGRTDVAIRLKAYGDTRRHGDFLGEIHGRIVDADSGEPVEVLTHRVRTCWLPPEAIDWRREILSSQLASAPVQTAQMISRDGEGESVVRRPARRAEFSRIGLSDGRYRVRVDSADHALGWAGPFEMAPGRLEAEVVVSLQRGATVEGLVRDAAGRPVDGALVWVDGVTRSTDERRAAILLTFRETGGEAAGRLPTGSVRTEVDGRFSIPRVPPGLDLRVHAVHPTAGDGASAPFVLRAEERARRVGVGLR